MTGLSTRLAAVVIEIDPAHLSESPWSLVNSVKPEHWDDLTYDLHKLGAICVEQCKPTTGCWYITFSVEEPIGLDMIKRYKNECYNLYKSYQDKAIT